jgi:erythromycin esterase-like protein
VTFFGFDVQDPWKTGPAARAFVRRAAPADAALLARAEGLLRCLGAAAGSDEWFRSQQYRDHAEGRRDAAAHGACLDAIAGVERHLADDAAALERATSPAEVEEARIALASLRAWEQQLWVPDPGGYQARDQGMAELFRRLLALRAPGRRAVIWAWNWHIARRYEEVRGFDDDSLRAVPRQGARAMGSFLHEALGAAYLPIGLVGYRVEINSGGVAPPLQTHPLSVERRLQALRRGYLLVDLRRPVADTLLPAGRRLQVSQEWGDPYRQFGALVFLEHSPPMTYVTVP